MTSKNCGIFEDISKNRNSRAWKYYLFDKSTSQAKCQLCFKQLSAKGSSTKNLLDHLSRIHSFDINSVKENEKQSSIKKHVKRILEPIEEVISDLAVDGFSYFFLLYLNKTFKSVR